MSFWASGPREGDKFDQQRSAVNINVTGSTAANVDTMQ